jgi:hypothetical protein
VGVRGGVQVVRTRSVCRVLVVPKEPYARLCIDFPTATQHVLDNLLQRAREVRGPPPPSEYGVLYATSNMGGHGSHNCTAAAHCCGSLGQGGILLPDRWKHRMVALAHEHTGAAGRCGPCRSRGRRLSRPGTCHASRCRGHHSTAWMPQSPVLSYVLS